MKKHYRKWMTACLCLVAVFILAGHSGAVGTTGGMILQKAFDPRAEAMGEAYTAVTDDVYSLYWNPAGLSYLGSSEITTSFSTGIVDDYLAQFSYAQAEQKYFTWALGVLTYSGGQMDLVDSVGQGKQIEAQRDWLWTWAGAYRLSKNFRLGWGVELLHSTLVGDVNATTMALSLGTSFNLAEGLRLDGVIKHAGLPMNYGQSGDEWGLPFTSAESGDPLPLTGALGVSYKILDSHGGNTDHDLLAAMDCSLALNEPVYTNVGLEYWYRKMIALRGGYKFNRDLDWLTLGAGFQYPVFERLAMQMNYSFAFTKDLNQQHKLALDLFLPRNAEREQGARVFQREFTEPYSWSLAKFGFGAGQIYGGVGLNAEIMAGNYVGLFAGVGSMDPFVQEGGLGGAAGARIYMGSAANGFRGRGSVFVSNTPASGTDKTLGIATTLGFQWRIFEALSLDLDAGVGGAVNEDYPYIVGDAGLTVHIPRGDKAALEHRASIVESGATAGVSTDNSVSTQTLAPESEEKVPTPVLDPAVFQIKEKDWHEQLNNARFLRVFDFVVGIAGIIVGAAEYVDGNNQRTNAKFVQKGDYYTNEDDVNAGNAKVTTGSIVMAAGAGVTTLGFVMNGKIHRLESEGQKQGFTWDFENRGKYNGLVARYEY
jgi:hypothetical protein